MRTRRLAVTAVLAALAATAAAAAGGALTPPDTSRLGHIDLYLADVEGSQGTFFELVGDRRIRIGAVTVDRPTAVELPAALTWSCTRRTRRLVVDVVHPDGSTASARYVTRTPGCRDRFALTAPRAASPGARVRVKVVDRGGLGALEPRLCVRSPTGHRTCRPVAFAGATSRTLPLTL